MALSRRTGARFQASIWPGFVDAMTGLLLVLTFVLSIFMVIQFVLSETITGQEDELDVLSGEIAALAQALGLQERRNDELTTQVGALESTLSGTEAQLAEQQALVASLLTTRDEQAAAIADFESQVATLLLERNTARDEVAALTTARDTAQAEAAGAASERDALAAALASARAEMDQQVEEARLAAAKREAMEALLSDLQTKNADLETALSEEELTRLAESEAAAALRARLENADAELTAMTLALEAERKKAEETLTLLAAARQAEADLNAQLVAALLQGEDLTRNLQTAQSDLATTQAELADTKADLQNVHGDLEQSQQDLTATQDDLQSAQDDVEAARAARRAVESELESLQDGASDRAALVGRVADLETRLAQILQERGDLETSAEEVRAQLVAALAAQKAAEAEAAEKRSAAEQRDILLAVAQDKVAESEERASASAKQAELLNQQVTQLRSQLGELQSILDDSKARDAAAQIQIEQLGSELNAAIARVAQEERRRRQLEEERARQLEEENKSLANYRSEFFGRLREVIGDRDGVRIEGDRFVFSSEVLFGVGSADLSPQGQREISKVAAILRDIAADVPSGIDWIIRVDGHTDDVPIRFGREFQDNWELSQARALSVVRDMIQFHGIPPERLAANGFGEYQPVNSEKTAEARAQNRRIELKLTER